MIVNNEDKDAFTIAIAALFRAAEIAGPKDPSASPEGAWNTLAIERAKEFIRACEAHGLIKQPWPERKEA